MISKAISKARALFRSFTPGTQQVLSIVMLVVGGLLVLGMVVAFLF